MKAFSILVLATVLFATPVLAQAAAPAKKRDSLKNGAIIGAVVGAVALGGFGGYLCVVLAEPGDPPCLPDILRIAAVGAGIGAGAGIGIDAMISPRNLLRPNTTDPRINARRFVLTWRQRF
jgi:hypothetical protein